MAADWLDVVHLIAVSNVLISDRHVVLVAFAMYCLLLGYANIYVNHYR